MVTTSTSRKASQAATHRMRAAAAALSQCMATLDTDAADRPLPCEFGCGRTYSTLHARRQHYRRQHVRDWNMHKGDLRLNRRTQAAAAKKAAAAAGARSSTSSGVASSGSPATSESELEEQDCTSASDNDDSEEEYECSNTVSRVRSSSSAGSAAATVSNSRKASNSNRGRRSSVASTATTSSNTPPGQSQSLQAGRRASAPSQPGGVAKLRPAQQRQLARRMSQQGARSSAGGGSGGIIIRLPSSSCAHLRQQQPQQPAATATDVEPSPATTTNTCAQSPKQRQGSSTVPIKSEPVSSVPLADVEMLTAASSAFESLSAPASPSAAAEGQTPQALGGFPSPLVQSRFSSAAHESLAHVSAQLLDMSSPQLTASRSHSVDSGILGPTLATPAMGGLSDGLDALHLGLLRELNMLHCPASSSSGGFPAAPLSSSSASTLGSPQQATLFDNPSSSPDLAFFDAVPPHFMPGSVGHTNHASVQQMPSRPGLTFYSSHGFTVGSAAVQVPIIQHHRPQAHMFLGGGGSTAAGFLSYHGAGVAQSQRCDPQFMLGFGAAGGMHASSSSFDQFRPQPQLVRANSLASSTTMSVADSSPSAMEIESPSNNSAAASDTTTVTHGDQDFIGTPVGTPTLVGSASAAVGVSGGFGFMRSNSAPIDDLFNYLAGIPASEMFPLITQKDSIDVQNILSVL